MRVRSSSAPTVRSRANHLALSTASPAGSTKPVSSSTSRSVKWSRLLVLEHEHPDDRLAGREDRVHARAAGGQEPRSVLDVGHAHEPPFEQRGPHRPRQLEVVDAVGWSGALPAHDLPAATRVVVEQQHRGVEAEQVADPLHRRVEHLVQVERGGEALGDPVEREQQRVGVGQPAQPVEGERVLPVGLAGDPPGVPGDERDEQELARPLDARAEVVDGVALAGQVGDRRPPAPRPHRCAPRTRSRGRTRPP